MNDLSNPADVRRTAKAAREAELVQHEIIRGLMSLPQGRAWMFDLLGRCHVFTTTFTGRSLSMAFQEGERSIGLSLVADITAACPDQFIAMMREAQNNERSTRPRSAEGLDGDDRESDAGTDTGAYDLFDSNTGAGG